MTTPGDRLRRARVEAGFDTQEAACKAFGWPLSTYRSTENEHRPMTARKAERYSSGFRRKLPHCTPEWLLYGTPPGSLKLTPLELSLVELYREADESVQRLVVAMLQTHITELTTRPEDQNTVRKPAA